MASLSSCRARLVSAGAVLLVSAVEPDDVLGPDRDARERAAGRVAQGGGHGGRGRDVGRLAARPCGSPTPLRPYGASGSACSRITIRTGGMSSTVGSR